jgi:hypothetical protein
VGSPHLRHHSRPPLSSSGSVEAHLWEPAAHDHPERLPPSPELRAKLHERASTHPHGAPQQAKRRPRRAPSLWPREHGAYMQLAFPMVSAWILGRPGFTAFALGVAAWAVFLAHEPLMVVAGRRGPRRQREQGPAAVGRLTVLTGVAGGLGAVALWLAQPLVRWLVVVMACVGAVSLVLAWVGRERHLLSEVYLSFALAAVALPVAVASGLAVEHALLLVGTWTVAFTLGTVAARGVLLQKRDGERGLRFASALAVMAGAGGGALAATGVVAPMFAFAPLPFVAVALVLTVSPPSPRRMMAIGFALLGACLATLLILALARGQVTP